MKKADYLELLMQAVAASSTRAKKAEKMLVAIEQELESRDFTQVSTEALLQCKALFSIIGLVEEKWQSSCFTSEYFEVKEAEEDKDEKRVNPQTKAYTKLGVDPLSLHIGIDLMPLFDEKQGGTFIQELGQLRNKLVEELGYALPDLRILDSYQVGPNEYVLYIRHRKVASGRIYPNRAVVFPDFFKNANLEPPQDVIVDAYPVYDNVEAHWYLESILRDEIKRDAASPVDVICNHLREVAIQHADAIISHFEAAKLVELVKQSNHALIQELTPALIPITTIREVIAGLLRERVSIRDILYVFECITKHAHECQDSKVLLERVRCSMAKIIVAGIVSEPDSKSLYAISLPVEVEEDLNSISRSPEETEKLHRRICKELMKTKPIPQRQLIICAPEVRLEVFKMVAPTVPDIAVITLYEVPEDIEVTWLE